jgi:glycosyltransferase involved in cell wall biosynthesis
MPGWQGRWGNFKQWYDDRMDVLVVAGMIDRKLFSKILPLMKSKTVTNIYLVRRDFAAGEKITCFSPRGILQRNLVLAELYRVMAIIYVLVRYRPEVVIGIGLLLHGLYTNILGTVFGKKKILLLMGKNDLALTYPHRKRLQRILLRVAFLADFLGTRGTLSRRWLAERGFAKEKVFIPHNVFDFGAFSPRSLIKKYDMIYVGLLSPYKRIDLLLEVVHKLVFEKHLGNARLAIVGDGKSRGKLKRQCRQLKLSSHVDFLPPGDASYVCDLLNQSRVFVMTSQGEGLPMAMIEAMSCGLPVVICDDADIGDVVRNGENGFLIRPGDLDGFAEAVSGLLMNPDLYKKLRVGALRIRAEYKQSYSLEGTRAVWERGLVRFGR